MDSLDSKECKDIKGLAHVADGWACCKCRSYNGEQRDQCKHCGHHRCGKTN